MDGGKWGSSYEEGLGAGSSDIGDLSVVFG